VVDRGRGTRRKLLTGSSHLSWGDVVVDAEDLFEGAGGGEAVGEEEVPDEVVAGVGGGLEAIGCAQAEGCC